MLEEGECRKELRSAREKGAGRTRLVVERELESPRSRLHSMNPKHSTVPEVNLSICVIVSSCNPV